MSQNEMNLSVDQFFHAMLIGNFTALVNSMQRDNLDKIEFDILNSISILGERILSRMWKQEDSQDHLISFENDFLVGIAYYNLFKFNLLVFLVNQAQGKLNISLQTIEDLDAKRPLTKIDNYYLENGITYEQLKSSIDENYVYIIGNKALKYYIDLGAKLTTKDIPGHDLGVIHSLIREGVKLYDENTGEEVISSGAQPLKYLIENGAVTDQNILKYAIRDGIEAVIYLVEELGVEMQGNELSIAAARGDSETINYLLEKGLKAEWYDLNAAAHNDNIDALKALVSEVVWSDDVENQDYFFGYIIKKGDLDLIKQLLEIGVGIEKFSIFHSILNNQNHITKFLVEQGVEPSNSDLELAISNSNIEMVKLFNDKGFEITDDIVKFAVTPLHKEGFLKDLVSLNQNYSQNEELMKALENNDYETANKVVGYEDPLLSSDKMCYDTIGNLQLKCKELGYEFFMTTNDEHVKELHMVYLCDYFELFCAI